MTWPLLIVLLIVPLLCLLCLLRLCEASAESPQYSCIQWGKFAWGKLPLCFLALSDVGSNCLSTDCDVGWCSKARSTARRAQDEADALKAEAKELKEKAEELLQNLRAAEDDVSSFPVAFCGGASTAHLLHGHAHLLHGQAFVKPAWHLHNLLLLLWVSCRLYV